MIDVDRLADAIADRLATRLQPDDRSLLSPRDLGVRLGISERAARDLINGRRGRPPRIPSIIVGDGSRRIRPEAVDAYLEAQGETDER